MTPRDLEEYKALRATIRQRGTTRTWVFVVGLSVWAALSLAITAVAAAPLLSILSLVVLAASFEAVFALHVTVERVGRYLQVFHDDLWEQAAMSLGAPLAGTGSDPLFGLFFGLATACNFIPVLLADPVRVEWIAIGGAHMAFLVRIVVARQVVGRQRAADLARFQQVKHEIGSKRPMA